MNISISCVILLATLTIAEKQIKLEDIERDNLISERRAIGNTEILQSDQTQHLRPPGIQASSSYENSASESAESAESAENDLNEDIIYASQPGNSAENYRNNEPQQQLQYVTPAKYEQSKEYTPQSTAPYAHPVHEATHTYSAPARQSLINPIIYKPNGTPSPYLAQQPRYVYVQAGAQQLQPNGILTYGQPQHSAENFDQQQQTNAQDDITYASIEQNQLVENSQQSAHAPPSSSRSNIGYGSRNYVQYVPYLAHNPNAPAQTQAYSVPNAHSNSQQREQQILSSPNEHLSAPQPTVAYAHTRPVEETAVLHAPESTAVPTLQYTIASNPIQSTPYHATAHPIQYTQQPIQLQESIEYAIRPHQSIEYHTQPTKIQSIPIASHLHHYLQNYGQPNLTPTLDFFGAYNKHPNSLLDSYIPSSVILARQHLLGNRQLLHATQPSATQLIQHGSHQPGYNTIAYSVPQGYGYAKRSPKLIKLNKKN